MAKSKSKKQKELRKAMSGAALTPQEQARKAAPRNEIVRAMVEQRLFQSTSHKDKRALSKRGIVKHKTRNCGF